MKASNKLNITVLLIVVCVAVFAVWHNREPKAEAVLAQQNELPMKSGPKAGLRAPSFSLQGTDGTTYVVDTPEIKR